MRIAALTLFRLLLTRFGSTITSGVAGLGRVMERRIENKVGYVEVYRTKSLFRSEKWRWRLIASTGDILAESGEGYANRLYAEGRAAAVCQGEYALAPIRVVYRKHRKERESF